MNCLPTNFSFDTGLQHIFIWFKYDKDAQRQFECPLNNQN